MPNDDVACKRAWWRGCFCVLLIALATFLAYANSLQCGFVWDDFALVVGNSSIRSFHHLGEAFLRDSSTSHAFVGLYRPLQEVSYWFDRALWGTNPPAFHATNVLLHFVNALLVFVLCRQMLGTGRKTPLFVALLFLLCPATTQSVIYISGRANLLGALFSLGAVILFLRGRASSRLGGWLAASVICFLLATLCNEITLALPLVILLADVTCSSSSQRTDSALHVGARLVPYLAVLAAYVVMRFWLAPPVIESENGYLSMVSRGLVMLPRVVFDYLLSLLLPIQLVMDGSIIETHLWSVSSIVAIALIVSSVMVIMRMARRKQGGLFFSFWLIIWLLPAASVLILRNVPLSDSWLYLPSVGFFCLIGLLVEKSERSSMVPGITPSTEPGSSRPIDDLSVGGATTGGALYLTIIAGLFLVLTVHRNAEWRNDISISESAVTRAPYSAHARKNLANALLKRGKLDRSALQSRWAITIAGYYSDAEAESAHVIGWVPSFLEGRPWPVSAAERERDDLAAAHNTLGSVYFLRGRYVDAMTEYRAALKVDPELAVAHLNLAKVHVVLGMYGLAVKELEDISSLVRSSPEYHSTFAVALIGLGKLEDGMVHLEKVVALSEGAAKLKAAVDFADVLLTLGRPDEAMGVANKYLSDNPDHLGLLCILGDAYLLRREYGLAERTYQRAISIKENDARPWRRMGDLQFARGFSTEAATFYKKSLTYDPKDANVLAALAAIHGKNEDYHEAIMSALKALTIQPDLANAYKTLGIAYMRTDRPKEAVEAFKSYLFYDPKARDAKSVRAKTRELEAKIDDFTSSAD